MKTKTIKAWAVVNKKGHITLVSTFDGSCCCENVSGEALAIHRTKKEASLNAYKSCGETARQVEIKIK